MKIARILILGIVMSVTPVAAEAQWSLGINDDNALQILRGGDHWQVGPQIRPLQDCRYIGISFVSFPFSDSSLNKISENKTRLFLETDIVYLPSYKGEYYDKGKGLGCGISIGLEKRMRNLGFNFGLGFEYTQIQDPKTGFTGKNLNPVLKAGIKFVL